MRLARAERFLLGALVGLSAGVVARPIYAQQLQVDQVQHASATGTSQGGRFSLYTALGSAGPSGSTSGGSYGVTSASHALLSSASGSAMVVHAPSESVDSGADLVVVCDVEIPGRIRDVELYFRRGGSSEYTILPMADDDEDQRYVATIPGSEITSEGLGYYFVARNSAGRSYRSPLDGVYSVSVRIPEAGLQSPSMLPGGTDQSAYRLISVPLDLDNKMPDAVLEDDFGSYDPASWRFFELLFDQSLREHPGTVPMTPGKAFWVITRDEGMVFDTGPGSALSIERPRPVALNSGWNLIGKPYHFDLPIGSVRLAGSDELEIRSFDGAWNDPLAAPVQVLRPFSGYAVFNPQPEVDTLYFDPEIPATDASSNALWAGRLAAESNKLVGESNTVLVASSGSAAKSGGKAAKSNGKAAKSNGNAAMSSGSVVESSNDMHAMLDWALRISGFSGLARDSDNYAGVSRESVAGRDRLDFAEPPSIGQGVSVYFPHPDWELPTDRFSTDFRPAGVEFDTWTFEVSATTDEPVQLVVDGIARLPESLQAYLVDEAAGVTIDLRQTNRHTVSSSRSPRRLRLVVGTGEAVESALSELVELPDQLTIEPVFPNPFRNSTTVSFGLPESAHVRIDVYDVTGKRVATIVDEQKPKGVHSIVWDGRAGSGIALPSGLYILHLRSEGASRSQRVTIIR